MKVPVLRRMVSLYNDQFDTHEIEDISYNYWPRIIEGEVINRIVPHFLIKDSYHYLAFIDKKQPHLNQFYKSIIQ